MEARWRRWIGPGIVSVGLLAVLGPQRAIGARDRVWDPPACDGGPAGPDRRRAATAGRTGGHRDAVVHARSRCSMRAARSSASGCRVGTRPGRGAEAHRPPRRVVRRRPVRSRRARRRRRRATLAAAARRRRRRLRLAGRRGSGRHPAGDRQRGRRDASTRRASTGSTRADLGVWRRPVDGAGPADARPRPDRSRRSLRADLVDRVRLVGRRATGSRSSPAARSPAGRGSSTRRAAASRPSRDPASRHDRRPRPRDRLVVYRACRGLPCAPRLDRPARPVAAPRSARPPARGHARRAAASTARVVHERFDRVVGRRLRATIRRSGRTRDDLGPRRSAAIPPTGSPLTPAGRRRSTPADVRAIRQRPTVHRPMSRSTMRPHELGPPWRSPGGRARVCVLPAAVVRARPGPGPQQHVLRPGPGPPVRLAVGLRAAGEHQDRDQGRRRRRRRARRRRAPPRSSTTPPDRTRSATAPGTPAGRTASPASRAAPRTASRCGSASRATCSTGAPSSGARPTPTRRTAASTPRPSRSTSSATSRASTTTSNYVGRPRLRRRRRADGLARQADGRLEHARVRTVRRRDPPARVRHAEHVGEVLDVPRPRRRS